MIEFALLIVDWFMSRVNDEQLFSRLINYCFLKHKSLHYHHIKFFHLLKCQLTHKMLLKLFKNDTRDLRARSEQ